MADPGGWGRAARPEPQAGARARVAADVSAAADLASFLEVRAHLATLPPWAGVPRVRQALALVHENSWSPMETRLRVLWLLGADLPPPLVNAPVFDLDGGHLGTPDLLDVEAGLAIEYDGADHLRRPQRCSARGSTIAHG